MHTIKKMMLLLFLSASQLFYAVEFSSTTNISDTEHQKIIVNFKLDTNNNEVILANSIHPSIDNPNITINSTDFSHASIRKHVPELNQKKQVYDNDFDVTVHLQTKIHEPIQAMLHISYLSTLNSAILDVQIPVSFDMPAENTETSGLLPQGKSLPVPTELAVEKKDLSWTATIQNLVEQTKSPWIQIILALLLGLLLSLTPCIYPMIPITIGILHSQGRKSLTHDFLGSLCYASGLATTFACLGLLATVAGSSFGSLLSHPPFVIGLVLFICYMSLTMIGIIDMYIPSFMKGEVKLYRNLGPFFAAYLFGAISGTIASPCVSPGLALLLSIVATLGSKILGFLLLFAFGMGLSIPLIIIGTFSNSLYLLPKSGMWMVEIKKGLGFFMMATCFYYLGNILPMATVYWLFTGFTLFTGLFYLIKIDKNSQYKNLHTLIGIMMISLTILMTTKSYEKTFYKDDSNHTQLINWQANYTIALDQAIKNNKLLLIDFWAHHCTICKAIDKKVFHNNEFYNALADKIVFVKIDATHSDNPDYMHTKELYKVYAQPAILLVNPTTQTIIKKWTSEPYSLSIEEFIQQIQTKIDSQTTNL